MLELQRAVEGQGLAFAPRAVAVTGAGSALDQRAATEGWLARFPMWDWVGGRTSVFSAVGLLPAALQGVDVRALLAGAAAMDQLTRDPDPRRNPAALLAAHWYREGGGRGRRDMVVLPYKDRLLLFSRYLQQLVMESLGKRLDRQGATVHQGLSVYGNKGSTDQHAYVQQLRDGLHNFFVVFVRVLRDRHGADLMVEDGVTSGDYLDGFFQGTQGALYESGRTSVTLTLQQLDERSLAALIALFERAVGLYAELCDLNAYHQPGVEAGKQAAAVVLDLQRRVWAALPVGGEPASAAALARQLEAPVLAVWNVLQHLAANRAELHGAGLQDPATARFRRLA
jgi:glucose-6-phosphate isomerase